MADVAKKKDVSVFSNVIEKIEIEYDFAKDGGAVGELILMEAKEALVIHEAHVKIKTAFTSGGSATLIVGVSGGDTDAVLASTAVADLTAPKVFPGAAACEGIYLASGGKISMAIGTAAMTAGKMVVSLEVSKF